VNPKIVVLNFTTKLKRFRYTFPTFIFQFSTDETILDGIPQIHRNYKSAFHPSRKCDFIQKGINPNSKNSLVQEFILTCFSIIN